MAIGQAKTQLNWVTLRILDIIRPLPITWLCGANAVQHLVTSEVANEI